MQDRSITDAEAAVAVEGQAEDMLAIATSLPHRYRHGGHVAGAREAMQNPELVGNLVKLGTFCAGLEDASKHSLAVARGSISMPTMLIGMGFHYAIEVAPRSEDDGLGPIIDLNALSRHLRRIEGTMGLIEIDPRLLDAINRLARERLMRGPEPDGGDR